MNFQVVLRLDKSVLRVGEEADGGASPVAVICSHVHDVAGRETGSLDGFKKAGQAIFGRIRDPTQAITKLAECGLKNSLHRNSIVIGRAEQLHIVASIPD